MAKIGTLQVTTGLISNQAINTFVAPSGTSITVTNNGLNPTMIWVGNMLGSNSVVLRRNRDNKLLFSGTAPVKGLAIDDAPATTETYTVTGTGAFISGAFVRRK